jgi:hypothetical protein
MKILQTPLFFCLLMAAFVTGCSSTSSFQAAQDNVTLHIRGSAPQQTPSSDAYNSTSFGNYDFKATKEGHQALYGILPLQFHPDRVVFDALFFAPGLFFNLRDTFTFYEIDMEEGVIRYKDKKSDPWQTYKPLPAETQRAQQYFEALPQ